MSTEIPTSTNGHHPLPPLRFGRYARVSTSEQAGPDTASIEDQLRDTLILIEREGGVLVDTYCDKDAYRVDGRLVDPSGERADRPQFQRMLADLKSGRINAIAAWHEWRLYRDFRPFTDFIEIARVTKPTVRLWHGFWVEQFAVFGAWQGKADNDHRTAQTGKGRRAKAEKGFPLTAAPDCYKVVRNDQGKRAGYELRGECRDYLARAAALFVAGTSYADMAIQLGRNPITGVALSADKLRDIMRNPFFRGKVAPKWRDGAPLFVMDSPHHPAAWDAATCAAIERELARRAALGRSQPHSGKFLLSGLLRCGICGRLMSGHVSRRGKSPWYACPLGERHKKPQPADRGRTHGYNGISEHKVIAQLMYLGEFVTEANAEEVAARYVLPGRQRPGPTAETLSRKRAELAETQAELDVTPASSIRAHTFLTGEVARLFKELAQLEKQAEQALDPRAAIVLTAPIVLRVFRPDTFKLPPAALRAELQQLPAVWAKDGRLCDAPESLWIEP